MKIAPKLVIEDFLRKLDIKQRFSQIRQKKYKLILRDLRMQPVNAQGRKCLIIQIDGLSHPDLLSAVNRGFMWTLRKLVEKKGYGIQKMNPGLPSNTTYFQASVMYGDNTKVPGYHVVDKKLKRQYDLTNPGDLNEFERKFLRTKGLMTGGSTYGTLLAGGAQESYLTMSTILSRETYKRVPVGRVIGAALLTPARMLWFIGASFVEIGLEIAEGAWDRFSSLFEKTSRNPFIFSLGRILFNVLAAELTTTGALLDTQRGIPIIWLNYIAYDELGHHRGPKKLSAYRILWKIDKDIKRIMKALPKDYDVYIISDHGMNPAIPFEKKFGYTFQEYVEALVKSPVMTHERFKEDVSSALLSATVIKIASFPFIIFKPIGWLFKGLSRLWTPKKIELNRKSKVIVEESSAIAHIYFTDKSDSLSKNEIDKRYPGFVETLAKHPGIGILCVRKHKGVEIYVRGTKIKFGKNDNSNLLENFGEKEIILGQLNQFMRMKYCGDIVVFGDFDGRESIALADHYGVHSGLGGAQNEAFILTRKELLPKSPLLDAIEFRAMLKRYERFE